MKNEDFYLLVAEREGNRRHLLGRANYYDTMEAAAADVEKMERLGVWPEGHDAVLIKDDKTWLYADSWEPLA